MAAPSSEPSRVGSRGHRRWPVGSTAPEVTRIHSGGVTPASCPVASPPVATLYIPVVPRLVSTPFAPLLSFSPPLFVVPPQELFNFGLLVPPGCRLAKPWRICKDDYRTLTNPATPEQLRVHPGGRYNTHGRNVFWDGKNYNDVIRRCRQAAAAGGGTGEGVPRRRRAAIPHPPPATPVVASAIPAEYEVPPEQFVLREDGDPDDSPGLLVAMRASHATAAPAAREEAEIVAAIQETAANPPPFGDDDDVDSHALANSSDDDNDRRDGDGAVDGPAVVYLDSD
ncbi:hypothetical protein ZWY2020_041135 [Hordeum vulgare]|nr:hypothetical protein ZWY2020_041135 [Hordeum vulgare]